jgi:hypothetical protein
MTGNENFRQQVALLTRVRIAHQHGFHKMEKRCERELLKLERAELRALLGKPADEPPAETPTHEEDDDV